MKRTLSLLPSTTEIIYLLGAEDQLVGVTHECDYPAAARSKPVVTAARINPSMASAAIDSLVRQQLDDSGTLYSLDMDLVRRLRPELVLTQQLCTVCAVGYATVHAAMSSLPEPPTVMNIEPRTLSEVFDSFIEVGEQLGLKECADSEVLKLRRRLDTIPKPASPTRILFLEWLIPPFSAGHWIAELVEAAGGIPVLANRGEHSRGLSWEAMSVLEDSNPEGLGEANRSTEFDVLVISCCGFSVERAIVDVESSPELMRLRSERPEMRVIVFDGNHFFSRPGPRLVESAELLHAALIGIDPRNAGSTVSEPYWEIGL